MVTARTATVASNARAERPSNHDAVRPSVSRLGGVDDADECSTGCRAAG